jgi:hypothetical protein
VGSRASLDGCVYSFFNLRTRWGGGSMPRPGPPPQGKETWYPLYTRLGGLQGQSGWMQKISPPPHPPGFNPQTVQPVESLYTDCTIPTHSEILAILKLKMRVHGVKY